MNIFQLMKIFLVRICQRSFALYVVVIVILYFLTNPIIAQRNRLNHFAWHDVQMSSYESGENVSQEDCRQALQYYYLLLEYKFAPPRDIVYSHIGFCYYYLGDYQEAIKAYQNAIAINPDLYLHPWDVGMIYLQLGDFTHAVHFLEQSLKLIPQTAVYYSNLEKQVRLSKRDDMLPWIALLNIRLKKDLEKISLALSRQEKIDFQPHLNMELRRLMYKMEVVRTKKIIP